MFYGKSILYQEVTVTVHVFDSAKVQDVATYEKPAQLALGMDYVFVAGQAVIDDGKMTALRPGRSLKSR